MTAETGPALLDISRLAARAGRPVQTGIDRVELAYLAHLMDDPGDHRFLVRHRRSLWLLDRAAGAELLRWCLGQGPLPAATLLRRLAGKGAGGVADALVRQGQPFDSRALHPGRHYLNVGHANLSDATFAALGPGIRRTVLIHDTIPLDHPEFSGPGATGRFREAFAAAVTHADRVVVPAAATARNVARWAETMGQSPEIAVARLGVTPPPEGTLPSGIAAPFFLALGTVEPRKDHALLLDLWDGDDTLPPLVIAGSRGWAEPALFARIERAVRARRVVYLPDATDATVGALLRHASALLAPSRAEGFGLPAVEASVLGLPVIATDLPVTRELLGAVPRYVPAGDRAAWRSAIASYLARPTRPVSIIAPSWAEHFNRVFNLPN